MAATVKADARVVVVANAEGVQMDVLLARDVAADVRLVAGAVATVVLALVLLAVKLWLYKNWRLK